MFSAERYLDKIEDDYYILYVKPPEWTASPEQSIHLNEDQVRRLREWLDGKGMIQQLFPEMSSEEREIIQTGLAWKSLS